MGMQSAKLALRDARSRTMTLVLDPRILLSHLPTAF